MTDTYERLPGPSFPVQLSPSCGDPDSPTYRLCQSDYPRRWWERMFSGQRTPPPQSGYLTLIPLSDSRLKPRRTKLLIALLMLLTLSSVCAVFLLVPRGVSVGTISVHTGKLTFNSTKSTYQILLEATLPIYNPNYLQVRVSGQINITFYDQLAGSTDLSPMYVPARSNPQAILVQVDASNVPQKYMNTIYTQCFTFPEKLIFFLNGKLKAEYLGTTYTLPTIDNYFIINCQS